MRRVDEEDEDVKRLKSRSVRDRGWRKFISSAQRHQAVLGKLRRIASHRVANVFRASEASRIPVTRRNFGVHPVI